MKPARILMISAYFYPKIGGSEKQLLTLAACLRSRGHTIIVLTQKYSSEVSRFKIINDIIIHRLPIIGKGLCASFSFMGMVAYAIGKLKKEFDIIHVNLASSHAIIGVIMGAILKKRVIIKLGGGSRYGDLRTSQGTLLGKLKLYFLKKSSAIFIAVSPEIIDELISFGFKKQNIVFISNGVDTNIYQPVQMSEKEKLREARRIPRHAVVFVFSGRLVEGKNIIALLKIWSQLTIKQQNLYLLIIGSGSEKEKIDQNIASLEITDTISVRNFQDDIASYYQCADIFISLSSSEGMSNSVLEAMACGLAVITTNAGGISKVIQDTQEGFIITEYNEKLILEKMTELVNNHELRNTMGKKGAHIMFQKHRIQYIAEQYESVYLDTS